VRHLEPTDLPVREDPDHVSTTPDEIKYLLDSARLYFPDFPERYDSTTIGARPILGQAGSEKLLSRDYQVFDHERRDGVKGFLTIGGGKMSDFRVMAEAATNLACYKLGVSAPCRTQDEKLDGGPAGESTGFALPWRPVRRFLRHHPRLRELHALAYLGGAFARHILRKATGASNAADAAAFRAHYKD
jgi:glycerol-3-phosphate dehydrogenase